MAYQCPNKVNCKNNIPFTFTKYFNIENYVQRHKYGEIIEAEPFSMDTINGKLTLTVAVRLNKNENKAAVDDFDTLLCANIEKEKISITNTKITAISQNTNETVIPTYTVDDCDINVNKPSDVKVISEHSTIIQENREKFGTKNFIFPNTYYFAHGNLGVTVTGIALVKECPCYEEVELAPYISKMKESAVDVSNSKTKTSVADVSSIKMKKLAGDVSCGKMKATSDLGITSKPENENGNTTSKPGLAQDMAAALKSTRYCDVTLNLDFGKTISAHKIILWARSKFFAEKIEEEDKPYNGSMLTIPVLGFKYEVVQEAVHFMYTNECPKLSEMPIDLLSFADKFKIPGLRKIAEDEIKSIATTENICNFLNLADANNYEDLKVFCIEFVRKNKKAVVEASGWKVLRKNNPGVIASVFEMTIND